MAIVYLTQNDDHSQVDVAIATAVANISGASPEQLAVAQKYCLRIINSALTGLEVPGGDDEKEKAR